MHNVIKEFCPVCMEMHEKEKVTMLEDGVKENVFMAEYYYCSHADSYYEDEHLIRINSKAERESRMNLLQER